MKLLHVEPLDVGGIPVDIKVAGVVAKVNLETTQDARAFLETLRVQLSDMAARIKNIHAYF